METKIEKRKIMLAGAVVLLILALIGTGIFYNANRALSKNLNSEKLKTEMLLSEKLALQKEINSYKKEMESLTGRNTYLDKLLAEANQKLNEKEIQLNRIVRENGNIKALKKEVADLAQLKKDFEKQVAALNETIQKLNKEKDALNETIASLRDENKELAEKVDYLSSMAGDNYLFETTKRNDKLTVLARRTKKMTMTFDVPEKMADNIAFKLTTPNGKVIDSDDVRITYRVISSGIGNTNTEKETTKTIEMVFSPKEKQKAGTYKIDLYDGEKHAGTCSAKLR